MNVVYEIYEWIGWFFCEAAFKTWELGIPEEQSDEEFIAKCLSDQKTILDVVAQPLYNIGIWFSEKSEI
jgi:hypothetical protein